MKQRMLMLLATFVFGAILGWLLLAPLTHTVGAASIWFVSRNGNNTTGQDWATAWNELNQIRWDLVAPGDTILVDGGSVACPSLGDEPAGCGMVYNTLLAWGQNGVIVRLSADVGHDGTAIFDGNQTNFTYCVENVNMPTPPRSPNGPILGTGVTFNGRSGAVLDGTKWGGIVVRNAVTYGINLGGGDGNVVRHVKVHHINNPNDTTNNSVGIVHSWTAEDVLVEKIEVYRIGQDGFRVQGDRFTLRDSYIHDIFCNHPDGIQALVYTANNDVPDNEGKIEDVSVIGNVWERVGLQVIFMGENSQHNSWVDGAIIRDNLFLAGKYIIKSKHAQSTGWLIERNTFAGSTEFAIEWCCGSATAPMTIRDNIFYQTRNPSGTGFYLPTLLGRTAFTGNCVYQGGGRSGSVTESGTLTGDPLFVNIAGGDYALQVGSPCAGKGSALSNRLSLVGTPIPSPTPKPTETPTPTKTLVPTKTATATITPTPTPACLVLSDGLVCFIPFTPTP